MSTRNGRMLRAALITWLAAIALAMLIDRACAQEVAGGLVLSGGLGEERYSPAVRAAYEGRAVRAAATWEGTRKLESGAGWIAGADVDYGTRITAGISYRYRNGGTWVKQSWWPRLGLIAGPARLVLRRDLSTANAVSVMEVRLRQGRGPVHIEDVVGVGRFSDAFGVAHVGVYAQVWIGVGR